MARLYRWYAELTQKGTVILHGIVTGHRKLSDGIYAHTTRVLSVTRDPQEEDSFIFQTRNTAYHLSMKEYNYEQHAEGNDGAVPDNIPGYAQWLSQLEDFAGRFQGEKIPCCAENGSVLLRLGNNREYYFDAMDVALGTGEHLSGKMMPHVGMFQDSVLCYTGGEIGCGEHDLRYFPYRDGNLEFYVWETKGVPVYIENVGDCDLRVQCGEGVYRIKPGEQVLIDPDNADPEGHLTSRRDLYEAVVLDSSELGAQLARILEDTEEKTH